MMNWPKIVRRYGDTDFVTALRAIAATMVVVIHSAAFSDFGTIGQNIVDSGKYGVQIFFVISGFSIATTFATAANYKEFFIRRLFRIGPLYWFMIVAVAALTLNGLLPANSWGEHFGTDIDAYNILMHLSFLSCFDHRVGTTILGVEWTIPIEMFWYAALPLILTYAGTSRQLAKAFVCSVLAIGLTRLAAGLLISDGSSLFAKWFPTHHGPYFLAGVVAYRLRRSSGAWLHRHSTLILLAGWAAVGIAVLAGMSGLAFISGGVTLLTIGLFRPDQLQVVNRFLTASPLIFIGSVSYSLYLVHYPVILFLKGNGMTEGWALFAAAYTASLVISTFLYVLVELPMNQLGKKFGHSRPKVIPITANQTHGHAAVEITKRKAA